MPPVGLSISGSTYVLVTGQAKLWAVLVGVDRYQDATIPSLHYSAKDCQGLGEALLEATQEFPRKQILIQHDFADQTPTLATVRTNLQHVVSNAKPLDTVLFYFSGHGLLDSQRQQVALCLSDTRKDALMDTGLPLHELLETLDRCMARQQLVWLDACHSGGLMMHPPSQEFNSTNQLVQVLQAHAAQSRHFYALLSCDQGQQSWEFPDLGHGLFTHYLMRGLRGEAADSEGTIEADGLYKYVYFQTKQYIKEANHQVRLLNQQKRERGETLFYPEYPRQTPKRIVIGTGELILGLMPDRATAEHSSGQRSIAQFAGATPTSEVEPATQATGEVTIANTVPILELNNQGQILRFPLVHDLHRLGRDRQWSDLDVPKQGWEILSRQQAVLRKEEADYRIYDGDGTQPSRNGIFCDRTRIDPQGHLLQHGTTLEIGQDPHNQILLTYSNPTKHPPFVLPSKRRLGLRTLRDPATKARKNSITFWRQLRLLCERQWKLVWRDRSSLMLSLLTGAIGVALIALAAQASLSCLVLFSVSCITIWVGLSSSVQDIVQESSIYARDRLINLGLLPYLGSKFLIRAGLAVLQTLLIVVAVLLGFTAPNSNLLPWAIGLSLTIFLTLLSSISLGLMLSAFAKNENKANGILPLVMIPQIIFSGGLFELEGVASKISWLMSSRWSIGALGSLIDLNNLAVDPSDFPNQLTSAQPFNPNSMYQSTWQNLSFNWEMLCLHTLVYLLIALCLQKRKDVKLSD